MDESILGPWICWLIILFPAAAVAPWVLHSCFIRIRLRIWGVAVKAECTGTSYYGQKQGIDYVYFAPKGKRNWRLFRVEYGIPHFEEGDAVEVVYDRGRPSRSRTQFELDRWCPWAGATVGSYLFAQLVCGIVGVVFLRVGMFRG
ncbi:hypothetical protein ACIO3O_00140 [Streptomyces sp. NPDC087440]|uniref:hypothetical protein n=1 Tax=Streptomyces sp. NPDC087440 TaxID=3365790 RepID=UPI00382ED5C8